MVSKKNQDLAQLRETVLAKQKAVNNKVSRIKSKGIIIANTEHDVRRDPSKVKGYNTHQLKNYLNELNTFMNPKHQFVKDARNQPLRKSEWLGYKILEDRYNKRVNANFARVEGIMSPNSEETLHERMLNMMPTRQRARKRPVNSTYDPPVRASTAINGSKGLAALTRDMQKRLNPDYLAKALEVDKKSFLKTLTDAGQNDLADMARSLSPEQFSTAWQFTDLANEAFTNYETIKAIARGNIKPDTLSGDSEMSGIHNILAWAKELPSGNAKKKKSGS